MYHHRGNEYRGLLTELFRELKTKEQGKESQSFFFFFYMRKHHCIWAGRQRKDVLLLEPQRWDYTMAGRSKAAAAWSSWAHGGRIGNAT